MIRSLALLCSTVAFLAAPASAQTWTSSFVGTRGLAGSATVSGDTWTIDGGGADVWDGSDAFQFLHQTVADDGGITARIDDLGNTDTYAKAGVMVRASLDPASPTAILDIRPGGELEFMVRRTADDPVSFIRGGQFSFPAWLALSWSAGSVRAWNSGGM